MKIVYWSGSGNTEKMANLIAQWDKRKWSSSSNRRISC